MADGRRFRYDEGGWQTYKFICPLIQSDEFEKALQTIIAKGEIKFTIRNYHSHTAELWCDTTYSRNILDDVCKRFPQAKMSRQ